ncbi:hypothetical protein LWI29_017341 [Acer saccharum]|uniref:Receptor ligand binding region domain-containing protein n=1 Tax=Acer saccharum TaxID=4024 RepID=A0AA39T809_ACESA|nr:hypothetical protein LWI29_017341 [Acer saccharum]
MNIGAVISFETNIGKLAKVAIEAAVKDVNPDPTTLVGTKLKVTMQDSNRSGILATAQDGCNSRNCRLLWMERSYSIYGDDEHGRNGIAALGDKLTAKRCKITFKACLSPTATKDEITDLLVKVALSESRILLVHTSASWGMEVFLIAHDLGMVESGYVWIATDWLSTVLDTNSPLSEDEMEDIQGIVSLRMHTPDSVLRRRFVSRWKNLTSVEKSNGPIGLNTYGLYAYDTVWLLAHAIDSLFRQGGNISFSKDSRLAEI